MSDESTTGFQQNTPAPQEPSVDASAAGAAGGTSWLRANRQVAIVVAAVVVVVVARGNAHGTLAGFIGAPREIFGKLMSVSDELRWRYIELKVLAKRSCVWDRLRL